jgi:hypothetical protein
VAAPISLPAAAAEPTLSKAVVRAAALLDVNQTTLARILGVSKATASRLTAGTYVLAPGRGKEWELALLFVRMFRSLDAVVADPARSRLWLHGDNTGLGARPFALAAPAAGLARLVHYLDAARGTI